MIFAHAFRGASVDPKQISWVYVISVLACLLPWGEENMFCDGLHVVGSSWMQSGKSSRVNNVVFVPNN